MATPVQENLKSSNASYASSFDQGGLAMPPSKQYLVVTCMDARIDPAAAFGIPLGSAHVIRNAGGIAEDAYRSIIISEQLLGTKEILLVKHTDCGMLIFQDQDVYGAVEKSLGAEARREVDGFKFLPFPEIEEAVRKDVAFLRAKKSISQEVPITGWVYEVETGKVRQVV